MLHLLRERDASVHSYDKFSVELAYPGIFLGQPWSENRDRKRAFIFERGWGGGVGQRNRCVHECKISQPLLYIFEE